MSLNQNLGPRIRIHPQWDIKLPPGRTYSCKFVEGPDGVIWATDFQLVPQSPEEWLEKRARKMAAAKMGLVRDPEGLNLPDDLWQQCLAAAKEESDEEMERYSGT